MKETPHDQSLMSMEKIIETAVTSMKMIGYSEAEIEAYRKILEQVEDQQ